MSNKINPASPVAVVTGAAGTIGRVVADRLSSEGWKVAGIDLKKADVDLFLPVDVTDRAAMAEAADRIVDNLGTIGLLVTGSGQGIGRPLQFVWRKKALRSLSMIWITIPG